MQVLKLLGGLPHAIATDYRQTLCALQGHGGLTLVGTSFSKIKPVPGRPSVWDLGQPTSRHYRCKRCDKSVVIKC